MEERLKQSRVCELAVPFAAILAPVTGQHANQQAGSIAIGPLQGDSSHLCQQSSSPASIGFTIDLNQVRAGFCCCTC